MIWTKNWFGLLKESGSKYEMKTSRGCLLFTFYLIIYRLKELRHDILSHFFDGLNVP